MRAAFAFSAVAVALGVSAIVACATVESTWASGGVQMAAFDLQCAEEKLEVVVLHRNDGLGCLGSRVGVRGCGKQTTYGCDNARQWQRTSEIVVVDGAAPAHAPFTLPPQSGPASTTSAP